MNKIFYSLLLFAGVCVAIASCSSGAYVANPSSNGNNSVNPLYPLKASQFNWASTAYKFSVNINGAQWATDSAFYGWNDSLQINQVYAYKGKNYIRMDLANVWAGNVYNMGFKIYSCVTLVYDSLYDPNPYLSSLGNSGEVYISTNDSAIFAGQFYFQGVNDKGTINNYSNGYFSVSKF